MSNVRVLAGTKKGAFIRTDDGGTTGGQVYCSPDGVDTWQCIAANLPKVFSVEVPTLK
ncbi:MAG: hypothetical protein ACKVYV_17305 [Limisphaerales bacterium]